MSLSKKYELAFLHFEEKRGDERANETRGCISNIFPMKLCTINFLLEIVRIVENHVLKYKNNNQYIRTYATL